MMLPTLRTKPLAKDFMSVGYYLHVYVIVWMIILAIVAPGTVATTSVSVNQTPNCTLGCVNNSLVRLRHVPFMGSSSLEQLCPGNTLTFCCEIFCGDTLAWTSEEYHDDRLSFLSAISMVGDTMPRSPSGGIVANFTGTDPVASLLYVTLTADIPNATITCHNTNHGHDVCARSMTFHLIGKPDVPQNVLIQQTSDSDNSDASCTLHVYLDPPNNIEQRYIDHYRVDYPSGSRCIGSSGSGDIIVPDADCNQDLRLNVTAIVCGNMTGAVASGIKPQLMSTNQLGTVGIISIAAIGTAFILIAVVIIGIICCVFIASKKASKHREHHVRFSSVKAKVRHNQQSQEVMATSSEWREPDVTGQSAKSAAVKYDIVASRSDELTSRSKPPLSANLPEDFEELIKTEVQKVLSQLTAKLSGVQEQDDSEKENLLWNIDTGTKIHMKTN